MSPYTSLLELEEPKLYPSLVSFIIGQLKSETKEDLMGAGNQESSGRAESALNRRAVPPAPAEHLGQETSPKEYGATPHSAVRGRQVNTCRVNPHGANPELPVSSRVITGHVSPLTALVEDPG